MGCCATQGVGVIVLANLDHAELRHAIMLDVFDRYIGGARRDWSADLRTLYGDAADARPRPSGGRSRRRGSPGRRRSLPLAATRAPTRDPLYGDVVVTLEGNRLRARYGGAYVGALEHWHYDTFRATWDAAWRGTALVTFVLDADGQPSRLESWAPASRGSRAALRVSDE